MRNYSSRGWRDRITVLALVALCAGSVGDAMAQRRSDPLAGLDAYARTALTALRVPGIAIAVVRNDSVVFSRGFGVRAAGGAELVDERTLFSLGSTGKAFTAAAAAVMVSDSAMGWDDPMVRLLPGFQLHDPYLTATVTLRDALSHRTGLPRGDLIWIGAGNISRAEILKRVSHLEPTFGLRAHWGYSNIMYLAAGEAAGAVSRLGYDELVRQRLLRPLGMTETIVNPATIDGLANLASGHAPLGDSVYRKQFWFADRIAPAGAITSNVRDMAQWLRFQLGDGTFAGQRVMSREALAEMHRPQSIVLGENEVDSLQRFGTYGMGWFVEDYRGALVWQHGGATDGTTTMVAMLPEHRVGVVVLTNVASTVAPTALMRYVFDRHLGAPLKDWVAEAATRAARGRAMQDSSARALERTRVGGNPPAPAARYVGAYRDAMYGDFTVREEGGHLIATRGEWSGRLDYWNGTTFRWDLLGSMGTLLPYVFVRFDAEPDGTVSAASFGLTPAERASFRRVVERRRR